MVTQFKHISFSPFISGEWKGIDKNTERILREGSALNHIYNFGLQCFPDFGGLLATDIALTLGSRVLPNINRPDFGNANIRSQINLMFHWFLAWNKTHFLRHFIETLVPHTYNKMSLEVIILLNVTPHHCTISITSHSWRSTATRTTSAHSWRSSHHARRRSAHHGSSTHLRRS